MLLSAVILCFNSERHIAAAVRSLAGECARLGGPCEIFVVDNGSRDASPRLLAALEGEFPGLLHVIRNATNAGTTVSRNLALRRATGRVLLVMDSDVVVPPGCIAALLPRLDSDPRIGLLAPRLVYPDGRPQLSADVFPTLPHKLRRLLGLRAIERGLAAPDGAARRVDYAISAFWLMPRGVVEKVGLLDERIFYSPEDVDYCLRVWAAGFEVVQDGSVVAIHDAREISRGLRRPGFALSHAGGLAYLFLKHRYALGRTRLYRRLGMAGRT
jgi:GT2 family glycosyltransferase